MTVEKALEIYKEYRIALIRDGDRKTFIAEIENKKAVA